MRFEWLYTATGGPGAEGCISVGFRAVEEDTVGQQVTKSHITVAAVWGPAAQSLASSIVSARTSSERNPILLKAVE